LPSIFNSLNQLQADLISMICHEIE
jgi:hypothetical protein